LTQGLTQLAGTTALDVDTQPVVAIKFIQSPRLTINLVSAGAATAKVSDYSQAIFLGLWRQYPPKSRSATDSCLLDKSPDFTFSCAKLIAVTPGEPEDAAVFMAEKVAAFLTQRLQLNPILT